MKVSIIGAGGFVGLALVNRILDNPGAIDTLVLVDSRDFSVPAAAPIPIVKTIGDIADPDFRESLTGRADAMVLLAAVLGGAAEANYELSRRVNVDATLSLFEAQRNAARPPRVVFASTIGVFGTPLPDSVNDATVPEPTMVYGAQKLMMEVALAHFSRRGWIDGVALRLPGIMARPGADARLKSAFLNNLFFAIRDGRDIELPVEPGGTTWLMSVRKIADNLYHALHLPPEKLAAARAFTLPCLRPTIGALVDALRRRYPLSEARVAYAADPVIVAQFGGYPPLSATLAESLGFTADRSIDDLVADALGHPTTP